MKAAISLTALASSAVAFDGMLGIGGPPGNLTTNEWQARFEDANATGTYYFEAYDVSDSFPPNETASGWSATIRVANVTDDPDPESIPYPGDCTNVASVPSSCKKWYGGSGTMGGGSIGNFSRRFNGSTLFSERPQLIGSSEYAKTEEEAYEEAVRGVWTVIINWGPRSPLSFSPADVLQPTVLCLRTRNITEGSEDPNAGARTAAYAPMALFTSMMAAIMLAY
ncbi:unnamed protein product [Fusarium langsethiae]|nr:unnamed protein product [Fusarium langsethiae]